MNKDMQPSLWTLSFAVYVLILIGAFIRVHSRIQTTLLGYEIAKMKEHEATLIKKRSLLNMELAKMTTKEYLNEITFKKRKEIKQTRKIPLASN